jgi:hypothetical protein
VLKNTDAGKAKEPLTYPNNPDKNPKYNTFQVIFGLFFLRNRKKHQQNKFGLVNLMHEAKQK